MKYKVIALSVHSDKLQKVLNAGDIVTDDMFQEGHAAKLIEQGFLIPEGMAAERQGPLKPFDATNDAPVEDPQNPLSQNQPAEHIEPIKPQSKKK